MSRRLALCLLWSLLPAVTASSQQTEPHTIHIHVDAAHRLGPALPIWSYFGYDEPNYTYTAHGAKLIGELGSLHQPVYIRVHNLLTTGDGTPALKWGSTNAYTEDAHGRPVYNWIVVDRIFDTFLHAGAKPFVEIGFMPKALSTKPDLYQHSWPKTKIAAGWAYPPTDYTKWAALISAWVQHSVARYGAAEVNTWYWEVWNEPDIEYWQGTPGEYNQLYDHAVDAVKRALPSARVGGPATTGPGNPKAAAFLRQFLEHCDRGVNAATGRPGAPLDFISYHAKGRPALVGGHLEMGIRAQLNDVARGMEIVTSFPRFHYLPIILSESDPEGCAACSARTEPRNAYRNGELYPAYTAATMNRLYGLAAQYGANLQGMLTWAFEFENQPYFDGFRTLATNGIDKPILNFFRVAAKLAGDRISATSEQAPALADILQSGVQDVPDVNALATRSARRVTAMVWNYDDRDVPAGADAALQPVALTIAGLPAHVKHATLTHYRIDRDHSNAFTAWRKMGSPQSPTSTEYAALERASGLQQLERAKKVPVEHGAVELPLLLPRESVSLLELAW